MIGYKEKESHPGLSRMKSVSFFRSSIVSLKYLKDIPYLSFTWCTAIYDVSFIAGSTKIKSISFDYCLGISDYPSLHGIPSIRIHTNQPGFFHPFFPLDQLSDTRYLYIGNDIPHSCDAISMRGFTNVGHMVVNNMTLRNLPEDIPVLEFIGWDFIGAQAIIEESKSPRIILKEGVYVAFMKELDKLPKFICDSSSPYELFDDPVAKLAVLLKNIHYQKPKNGPNRPLFMLDKLFYQLFGILPPPLPPAPFGVTAPERFPPGIPAFGTNIPPPPIPFGLSASTPGNFPPGGFAVFGPASNMPPLPSPFGGFASVPADFHPAGFPAFGPVPVDSIESDDSFP